VRGLDDDLSGRIQQLLIILLQLSRHIRPALRFEGKTELSYIYTHPVREGRPYNPYHGTLEARPVAATTSKLVYALVFDNSMLADTAAREKDKPQRTTLICANWFAVYLTTVRVRQ
jgi:hypothetical protein